MPTQMTPATEQAPSETPVASISTPLTPIRSAAPASGIVTTPLVPPPTLSRSDNDAVPAPTVAAAGGEPAVIDVEGPAATLLTEATRPAELGGGSVSVRLPGSSQYETKDKIGRALANGISEGGDARDLTDIPPPETVPGSAETVESLVVDGATANLQKCARNRVTRATLSRTVS